MHDIDKEARCAEPTAISCCAAIPASKPEPASQAQRTTNGEENDHAFCDTARTCEDPGSQADHAVLYRQSGRDLCGRDTRSWPSREPARADTQHHYADLHAKP